MEEKYKEVFAKWDSKSCVRSVPYYIPEKCGEILEGHLFNPNLIPVAKHPILVAKNKEINEKLEALYLLYYLDSVNILEMQIVNPALLEIMSQHTLKLPELMYLDAYKIYVDEGYHAYMAMDLKREVIKKVKIAYEKINSSNQLSEIEKILAETENDKRKMMLILAATINETLISNNLAQANDSCLAPLIKTFLTHHASDEVIHCGYFSQLFNFIWNSFSMKDKEYFGMRFPECIFAFLKVDYKVVSKILEQLPISSMERSKIFSDSCCLEADGKDFRRAAQFTLSLFKRNGVYDLQGVKEKFISMGLLDS